MTPKMIAQNTKFKVYVTDDGKIQITGEAATFAPDTAAKLAMGMLEAVQYIATELGDSMEDIPEVIQDTRVALTELKKQADRIDLIEG